MPQHKGMRWQTAVDVVKHGVEAHRAAHQANATRLGEFLGLLQTMEPPAKATRVIGITHLTRIKGIKGIGRSGKPQPGSIPDRVLEIVREYDGPVPMAKIAGAKHGAKPYSVILAVRALVKSGHLVASGATSSRRYGLPGIKRGRA